MTEGQPILLEAHLGKLDISITNSIFWQIVITVLTLSLLYISTRKLNLIPGKRQNLIEFFYEFIEEQVCKTLNLSTRTIGFLLSLFLYLLVNNLSGLIPGVHIPTSSLSVTGTLAVLVFLYVQFISLKTKGLFKFLKSFIPEGVSGPIVLFLYPLEIISQLLRPISLAIRLFANMTAGHMLILAFLGFNLVFKSYFVYPVSVTAAVLISLFEIFVSFIQAYIFTFLAALYIQEAMSENH